MTEANNVQTNKLSSGNFEELHVTAKANVLRPIGSNRSNFGCKRERTAEGAHVRRQGVKAGNVETRGRS